MNAIPGNPFLDENTTVEQMEIANAKYGLDQPLLVQMKNYLLNYLHGDMGESLKMQRGTPVKDIIFGQGKFELSIQLGVLALFLTVLMGIPLGCIAAYNRGKAVDNFLNVFSTVGIAAPNFVVATLLLTLLSVKLGILPAVSGSFNDPKAIIMPAIALSLYYVCYVAKLTRTSMLDAINQDYIRTARAKGLRTGSLIFKHALRNALIPVVTYLWPIDSRTALWRFCSRNNVWSSRIGSLFCFQYNRQRLSDYYGNNNRALNLNHRNESDCRYSL